MQSLRLVGPGEDGTSLILESLDGAERFSLPLDERLRDVSGNSSGQPVTPVPATPGQQLTPRDIQTRVRAGESAESLAEVTGMPLEKVMRFAYPVLAERARVVDEARRARTRQGSDGHAVEFGQLLDNRLGRHGIDPATVGWDAYRRPDGGWTVTAAFTSIEPNLLAKFSFGLGNRTVTALDALAADLLSDRPVRALLPPDPDPVSELPEPAPVRLAAVPDPASDPSPEPELDEARLDEGGLAPSPAVRLGRRQKAHTRPIPIDGDDELFDQEAFDDLGWQEPPLPLDLPADAAPAGDGAPDASSAEVSSAGEPDHRARRAGRRGEKPRMPSWDDILLGVRNKND